jgi:FtsH-binding integral membrane protein
MPLIAFALSLAVAALGGVGLVSPMTLRAFGRKLQGPTGLFAAAAFRIILGLALLFSASASRAPEVLRILGILIFLAGVMTLFLGVERFNRIFDWWSAGRILFMRVWSGVALAFGLLLAYAVRPY